MKFKLFILITVSFIVFLLLVFINYNSHSGRNNMTNAQLVESLKITNFRSNIEFDEIKWRKNKDRYNMLCSLLENSSFLKTKKDKIENILGTSQEKNHFLRFLTA